MAGCSIHHIGVGVRNQDAVLDVLTAKLGFKEVAVRDSWSDHKVVVKKSGLAFVVTTCKTATTSADRTDDGTALEYPDFSYSWRQPFAVKDNDICYTDLNVPDTVYEVCLEVSDVNQVLANAISAGAEVIKPFTEVDSEDGRISYAAVRSCVGNIIHTLVNTQDYRGPFLPGFSSLHEVQSETNEASDTIGEVTLDHLALCVSSGKTLDTIRWYEKVFSMPRLLVNKDEDPDEGLLLSEIGLKMAGMEYWRCAEKGISLSSRPGSVTFVIVESVSCSKCGQYLGI